jgi:hypothetical protein
LFIADLGLAEDLSNHMARHNSLFETLQVDPANFEFLMNVLFRKFCGDPVELRFSFLCCIR